MEKKKIFMRIPSYLKVCNLIPIPIIFQQGSRSTTDDLKKKTKKNMYTCFYKKKITFLYTSKDLFKMTIIHQVDFFSFYCKGKNFCEFLFTFQATSEKGSTLKGKNLLPWSTLKGKNLLPICSHREQILSF